jgi:uncharacterized membrane protein YdjX (TVP38/TMEM64 family)
MAGLAMLRLLGPDLLDQETLRRWLAPLGAWAPGAFVALLAVRPITLLPGQPFTALGGILFGAGPATLYALAGSLLATALVFWLSRRFGTRFVKRFAGEHFEALQITTRRHDFKLAAIVTLNPLLPTDMMIAIAGASGARFWPTALGTLVGTLPGTWLTAQFGSALGTGRTILTLVSAAGLLLSMALGVWLGRRFVSDFDATVKAHRERRYRHFPHLRGHAAPGR